MQDKGKLTKVANINIDYYIENFDGQYSLFQEHKPFRWAWDYGVLKPQDNPLCTFLQSRIAYNLSRTQVIKKSQLDGLRNVSLKE